MNPFESQRNNLELHKHQHLWNADIIVTNSSCEHCYPLGSRPIPDSFRYFWTWISTYYHARVYNQYTITAFTTFVELLRTRPPVTDLLTHSLTNYAYKVLLSIQYSQIPKESVVVYNFINLTRYSHFFSFTVDSVTISHVESLVEQYLDTVTMTGNTPKSSNS